jgi:hypothetical protein
MPGSAIVMGVLSRLPDADRSRLAARRRALLQRLGALGAATLVLIACLGPQTSNAATRGLAWLIGAAEAWRTLVAVLIGGLTVVPLFSALCLLALSVVLWQRLLDSSKAIP